MKLKTIKSQTGNKEYNKCLEKEIALIRKKCNIRESETVFFLGHFGYGEMFLCNGVIYISTVSREIDSQTKEPLLYTMSLNSLYKATFNLDEHKKIKDIKFETVLLTNSHYKMTLETFTDLIDCPSEINEEVDAPYYEVIEYLKNYDKNTFKTDRYLFYPKADGDSSFVTNLYAFDKKTGNEVKLYIPDKCLTINNESKFVPPATVNDIVLDDFGKNLSVNQRLQIKKAFLKLANEQNEYFSVKNYWVTELVKLTVQPVDIIHEQSIHRCFCDEKFNNIWVYDFPKENEEPSFMLINDYFTRVAVISFKSAKYLFNGIYKRGNTKAKLWKLDEKTLTELVEFLKSPSERAETGAYLWYEKYVKTNWQQLIFEYNHNSAGWGWGKNGFDVPPEKDTDRHSDIEILPFNLPIPDYTKLLKD